MLQSPKKKPQRPRRLTSISENPILEAKQDNKGRQLQVQRGHPHGLTLYPAPSRRGGGHRGHQHRRHYSVPDALMLQSAGLGQSNNHAYPKPLGNFRIDLNCGRDQQEHLTTISDGFGGFCVSKLQRPMTPPNQHAAEFHPATPQTPFGCFPPGNEDAAQMIDDLLSGIGSPVSMTSRRDSMIPTSSPLGPAFQLEGCEDHGMHQGGAMPDSLPTPPHTAHLQPVSAFDLAPLPHPNFVSMVAVSMSSESEVESYYSPVSSTSPEFPSVPSTPELKNAPLYPSTVPIVPEPSTSAINSFAAPDLPQLAPAPRHAPGTPSPTRLRASSAPRSLGAKTSGITMEEISSFISGPDQNGKWLCLYPECEKRFGRKENIKSHVQTHLGDRQFRCEACKKCFVRQHDLKRHSKIHTGVKPYPCLCGNSFARHDALTRHRQRGMCVGAFEGIVKKVVKRGRPRKKPLPEEAQKVEPEEALGSPGPDVSTGSSNPQTPYELPDFVGSIPQTPVPDTPAFGEDEATPRGRESSSDFLTQSTGSPGYSPPTSPCDEYDFESFVSPPSNRNSIGSNSLGEGDFTLSFGPSEPTKKFNGSFGTDEYSSSTGQEEFGLFSQDGMDMLGLTALERDPSILNFEDDIYIKPEFMSASECGGFY